MTIEKVLNVIKVQLTKIVVGTHHCRELWISEETEHKMQHNLDQQLMDLRELLMTERKSKI